MIFFLVVGSTAVCLHSCKVAAMICFDSNVMIVEQNVEEIAQVYVPIGKLPHVYITRYLISEYNS